MAVPTLNFTTGPATLPDVGELYYNGCSFSPLFASTVSGTAVKDAAARTVKLMEYTISVDGYVTLPDGAGDIAPTMATLATLLTAQGGELSYRGRGFDLLVNPPGAAGVRDVAWGPVPELLEFQPMGGGLSAKVKWQVKVRIPEIGRNVTAGALTSIPMLQFNYDTAVNYNEDGYSSLSIKGVLEIPLTRTPSQKVRTLSQTADDLRLFIDVRIMAGIDLNRFRVTKRSFNLSRDKRTLEFDFQFDEKPYMDFPPGCPIAKGSYNVRPARVGMGLCQWLCSLRVTYIVRADKPRRVAWLQFLALLRWRMAQSQAGFIPDVAGKPVAPRGPLIPALRVLSPIVDEIEAVRDLFRKEDKPVRDARKAWLMDFGIDEGMYQDSKTITFSASWRLVTMFSHILLASGIWTKLQERDTADNSLWATTIRGVSGGQSWLRNRVDPALDIVVDFGS